MDQTVE